MQSSQPAKKEEEKVSHLTPNQLFESILTWLIWGTLSDVLAILA
jgi:hypothetical protein